MSKENKEEVKEKCFCDHLTYETRLDLLRLEQERFDRQMLKKRLEFQQEMGKKKFELFKMYLEQNKLKTFNSMPKHLYVEYMDWFAKMSSIAPSFPIWM